MAFLIVRLGGYRRRLLAGLVLLAAVVTGASIAHEPTESDPDQRVASERSATETDSATKSAVQAVQAPTSPVKRGTLEELGNGWLVYRYAHPRKGFEIAFPGYGWRVAEKITNESLGEELGLVDIYRLPAGYNRIRIFLAERAWFSGNVDYRLTRASRRGSSTPSSFGGAETGLAFFDIQIGTVDGGIPMIGDVYFDPERNVVIEVIERSSFDPDNRVGGPIDATTTSAVWSSFRFLTGEGDWR